LITAVGQAARALQDQTVTSEAMQLVPPIRVHPGGEQEHKMTMIAGQVTLYLIRADISLLKFAFISSPLKRAAVPIPQNICHTNTLRTTWPNSRMVHQDLCLKVTLNNME
jgi:hypothetical protein